MDIIIYYLLCLLARKKIIVYVSYCLGTVAFVSLSYNTANQLYKIPDGARWSISRFSENISQISNNSYYYEERMQVLRNQCGNTSDPQPNVLTSLVRRSNMLDHLGFVLRSQSLFYCSVPKVATRTLLSYITYLHIHDELIHSLKNKSASYFNGSSSLFNGTSGLFNGSSALFNSDYLNQMLSSSKQNDSLSLLSLFLSRLMTGNKSNSTQLDLWLMYQKSALPYIRLRTLPNPSILFSTSFTRIIFVRHPLERLASAYEDKIASLKAEPLSVYDNMRRSICRKYASSYLTPADQSLYQFNRKLKGQINEPCQKIIPTFEHFVDYILYGSAQTDVHWQPYSTLCHTCTFKYNFIGKYETIQEDLTSLRAQLGLNSTDWTVENNFSTGKTKTNYISLYSKLSNDLICNLKDFYKDDFRLFNYQLEDYLADHRTIHCPPQPYRRLKVT